jgi:hypothetical protein
VLLNGQVSVIDHCGNFNSRITAWKRGSLRSGSMSESVFTATTPAASRRTAAGHSVHEKQPDAVNRAIVSFLNEI